MSDTTEEISKSYDPSIVEQKWYKIWEKNNYFAPKDSKRIFSMVIPPPNVTGSLHMGHALDNTLQDIITRYKRMNGFSALWLPGTDHAGIATQNVVEKELAKQGITRHDLGRDKFIEKVWEWKKEYGDVITKQLRRLGSSCDWSREHFTMDDSCSSAVKETFIHLYNEGLIYRGYYIINWCPRCHTALSDIEVDHKDVEGRLWYIRYPLKDDPQTSITVATTRPETMLGDTAVAVNPKDKRYKDFIGKNVVLPLTGRVIPVISDDIVDQSFGTGAVKVTPAHDPNDFDIGKRHNLKEIKIFKEDATLNENVPEIYQDLDRFSCRERVIEDLKDQGFLVKIEEHQHAVGHCYRCHTIVEPYLSKQWFVSMKELAKPAIEAVKSGKITIEPKRWVKLYYDWMENIRDWCISRQIWWGHRIPIWYCSCGETIASKTELKTCSKCGNSSLTQDEDVLDTWFSSALWPFSTMGWPEKTKDLKTFYPTTNLVTGYDIITFWVSRMIVMGLKMTGKVPFMHVYIHGLIRDAKGKKMSKSLGNAVDPMEIIEKNGTDSLRFALASLTTQGGQDIKLTDTKIEAGRNFANKLWNVSRYILTSLDKLKFDRSSTKYSFADKWILSRLNRAIRTVTTCLEEYDFAKAADTLYTFIWSELCDWYIEMSKLNKEQAAPVLIYSIETILRLLHPIMPFITEELWQKINQLPSLKDEKPIASIMLSKWPDYNPKDIHAEIETEMNIICEVIRNIRAEMNILPSKKSNVILVTNEKNKIKALNSGSEYIKSLAKVEEIQIIDSLKTKPKHSSTAVAEGIKIYMPLLELIDIDKEIERLKNELSKLEQELTRIKNKLSNENFIRKAPEDIVEKEKEKETKLSKKRQIILEQLDFLK